MSINALMSGFFAGLLTLLVLRQGIWAFWAVLAGAVLYTFWVVLGGSLLERSRVMYFLLMLVVIGVLIALFKFPAGLIRNVLTLLTATSLPALADAFLKFDFPDKPSEDTPESPPKE